MSSNAFKIFGNQRLSTFLRQCPNEIYIFRLKRDRGGNITVYTGWVKKNKIEKFQNDPFPCQHLQRKKSVTVILCQIAIILLISPPTYLIVFLTLLLWIWVPRWAKKPKKGEFFFFWGGGEESLYLITMLSDYNIVWEQGVGKKGGDEKGIGYCLKEK